MGGEASRENGKKGGRPEGTVMPETLKKQKVLKALQQRIMRSADVLFNAAKSSAIGNQFLYSITTDAKGRRQKPELVTKEWEITNYIEHLDENGEYQGDDDKIYYFISTKDPDIRAFNSLIDRAFGKNTESIDITSGGDKIIPIYGGISRHESDKEDIQPNEKD